MAGGGISEDGCSITDCISGEISNQSGRLDTDGAEVGKATSSKAMNMWSNQALQRRSSRSGCNPRVPCAGSLGRCPSVTARLSISALALIAGLLFGTDRLHAQTNGGPALTLVPAMYGYSLFASSPQSTNFVLQTSADLKSWTNLFQSFGWPGTNPVYGVTKDLHGPAQAFWRAVPGEPLLMQEQRWTNQEPVEYRFRHRRMISFWQGGVRGTVRVLHGVVVEV